MNDCTVSRNTTVQTNTSHSPRLALLPEDSRIRSRTIEGRGGHHTSGEVAKSGRICRGNSGPVRARITLALQLNVRFFTEGTYARSPGAAACVQIVSLAIPTPKLGGFSPTRAESAHCKLVASVGFVASKLLQPRELEEQTAAGILEGDRQAEMHAGVDDFD